MKSLRNVVRLLVLGPMVLQVEEVLVRLAEQEGVGSDLAANGGRRRDAVIMARPDLGRGIEPREPLQALPLLARIAAGEMRSGAADLADKKKVAGQQLPFDQHADVIGD